MSKKKILIGTRNKAKISMIKSAFSGNNDVELVTLNDLPPLDDSDLEEGNDYEGNARIKAEYYFKKTGIPTISTDQIIWIENWPQDDGFIIHIRKLVNPNVPKAADEETTEWIKNYLIKNGPTKAKFYYAIAFADSLGTKNFVSIQKEYILQEKPSLEKKDGYIFDRFMIDPKSNESKSEQSYDEGFENFDMMMKQEIIPAILI